MGRCAYCRYNLFHFPLQLVCAYWRQNACSVSLCNLCVSYCIHNVCFLSLFDLVVPYWRQKVCFVSLYKLCALYWRQNVCFVSLQKFCKFCPLILGHRHTGMTYLQSYFLLHKERLSLYKGSTNRRLWKQGLLTHNNSHYNITWGLIQESRIFQKYTSRLKILGGKW
jgi:hypothetical protein